ncbi:MAG TPA: alpha/beta hydrolase [Polyangiaceae bacterium]|nr:alpha/beta hydrolase [Polyangiaceae bacterium]
MRIRHGAWLTGLFTIACAACSSSTSAPPATADLPLAPPASAVVEEGPLRVRREVFLVTGATAPPNPRTGAATPPDQNKVRVVRFRVDTGQAPPKPARAVFVLMPGFLGGAGSFDGLARALVRRSQGDDAFEAWAIDRRSNLLEDSFGLDLAEARKDASLAYRYYLDGETLEGKTFPGFLTGPQAPWASEWGLATTVGDLRQVIALVPEGQRAERVVLVGHSLGASVAEEYAAWDFGAPGYKELAAMVLIDGVSRREGQPPATVDQSDYERGGKPGPEGFGQTVGVETDIRGGNVFFQLPFLGVKVYAVGEYLAMRARWDRDKLLGEEPEVKNLLSFSLGLTTLPKMTYRAAFGLAFDDASALLGIASVKCGSASGGPLGSYTNALGATLVHPTDPNATYGWLERDAVQPVENTALDDFARAWFEGPGVNYGEWYFPQRLSADVGVAGTLNIQDDDWRSAKFGLRAKYGKDIDVPIYGAAFSLVADTKAFDGLRAMVAPIGAGRPAAGKPRTDPSAFKTALYAGFSHLDGLVGVDAPGTPTGEFYDSVSRFAIEHTRAGGVSIPVQP